MGKNVPEGVGSVGVAREAHSHADYGDGACLAGTGGVVWYAIRIAVGATDGVMISSGTIEGAVCAVHAVESDHFPRYGGVAVAKVTERGYAFGLFFEGSTVSYNVYMRIGLLFFLWDVRALGEP